MLLRHIIIYPSQWVLQSTIDVTVTGRIMRMREGKSDLFNDKKYWPGICHI